MALEPEVIHFTLEHFFVLYQVSDIYLLAERLVAETAKGSVIEQLRSRLIYGIQIGGIVSQVDLRWIGECGGYYRINLCEYPKKEWVDCLGHELCHTFVSYSPDNPAQKVPWRWAQEYGSVNPEEKICDLYSSIWKRQRENQRETEELLSLVEVVSPAEYVCMKP